MNNKSKYIILSPLDKKQKIGGVVVIESKNKNISCFVSLFGLEISCPILLIDDLVNVRQFEISSSFSEIDLDFSLNFSTDIVVGLFDKDRHLLATGSTMGFETEEYIERLKISIEKENQLNHYLELAENVFYQKEISTTFLSKLELLLFELFSYGYPDFLLSKFIPNSKWVKIFLKNDVIGIGIVEKNNRVNAVGLAFPVFSKNQHRGEIDGNFTFFPQNEKKPNGFGYYVVLQDSVDGHVLKL